MKNLKKYEIANQESIKAGGNISWALGWLVGNAFQAMCYAGEGLERSGFNGAGANK